MAFHETIQSAAGIFEGAHTKVPGELQGTFQVTVWYAAQVS